MSERYLRMMKRFFAAVAALAATMAGAVIPDYQAIELYAGGPSQAGDVNNSGVVVGCYQPYTPGTNPGPNIAFKWKDGVRTDLGAGCAGVIGESGLIGGSDGNGNPVFWKPSGEMVPLGRTGYITDINSQDVASVQWWEDQPNGARVYHGFLWKDGQVTALPDGCGLRINDRGHVLCSTGIWMDARAGRWWIAEGVSREKPPDRRKSVRHFFSETAFQRCAAEKVSDTFSGR